MISTAAEKAGDASRRVGDEPAPRAPGRPEDEALRGQQAAAAARRHLAAAVETLRTMDPANPGPARDTALAELGAAAREQDAFLHAAAHDLRNPLTALRGQAQLLGRRARRDDRPGVDAARVRDAVAAIEEAADRTARLIDRLLDAGWLKEGSATEGDPAADR